MSSVWANHRRHKVRCKIVETKQNGIIPDLLLLEVGKYYTSSVDTRRARQLFHKDLKRLESEGEIRRGVDGRVHAIR